MDTEVVPSGHYIMGCIHELLPLDASPESLARLLRHECDSCNGARVLIDLTDHAGVDRRHVDVIIETITPEGERWRISLPPATDAAILTRLRDAGYEVVEPHHRA